MRAVQQQIWMSFPVEKRLGLCAEMFEFAREMAMNRAPAGLLDREKDRFVFRELYGFERPF